MSFCIACLFILYHVLVLQIYYASMIHHQRTCLGYKTLTQNIWWVSDKPGYAYIGKVIRCTTQFSVGSNELTWVQVYLVSLCWLKEETQTSGFVFPRTDSSDSTLYFNKKKTKQEILRNFKKRIWGIFFHNYILICVLPLKICVEVILLLFATVFWICSKDNTAILHSLWKKTAHSKAAELLSDK